MPSMTTITRGKTNADRNYILTKTLCPCVMLQIMTSLLEQVIDYQRRMGQEPAPRSHMNFFWSILKIKQQTFTHGAEAAESCLLLTC